MAVNWNEAEFVRSAVKSADFPADELPQVVFSGRSNVGKSSTINKLLNRKNFARVANTPGKTAHINYFLIGGKTGGKLYFVDLPGYGFAKVSKTERDRWAKLIEQWFRADNNMTLGVLIVDARHKPTEDDCIMCRWYKESGRDFVVVANKMDKLKKSEIEPNLARIAETLELPESVKVIPFSAEKGEGKQTLLSVIQASMGGRQDEVHTL